MSVRSNGSGDHLALAGAFGVTTGAFSLGIWTKVINAPSSYVAFATLAGDESESLDYISISTNSPGPVDWVFYDSETGAGDQSPGGSPTAGTWFWVTVVRSGTTVTCSIFDDTTSTTPVHTIGATGAGSIAALDWLLISEAFSGEWADAEFANAKLHAGIGWTNAQSRAESQHSAAQTGGGTFVVACSLQSLAAGLSNTGTLGGSLTNTGCVDGASNPTQLTFDGGIVADQSRLVTAIRTVA